MKSGIELPTKPKAPVTDVQLYTILIYGREKTGKTTWASQFPDALFLSTEPGTKGLEIYEIPINDWKMMRDSVKALERDRKRFRTVVIDTVDIAYDMCLDYVVENLGIEYPGEDSEGREDYGKSWRAVKKEFISVVQRIIRTGRGVIFISHANTSTVKTRGGDKWDRIYPSMSKQARQTVEALVDMFFYADYAKDSSNKTIRVLMTEGDETVWAGHRETAGGSLPPLIPLQKTGSYEVFVKAFQGKYDGLDPALIRPARETLAPSSDLMGRLRRKSKEEGGKPAGKTLKKR